MVLAEHMYHEDYEEEEIFPVYVPLPESEFVLVELPITK